MISPSIAPTLIIVNLLQTNAINTKAQNTNITCTADLVIILLSVIVTGIAIAWLISKKRG